jgi:hypothetical protein
MQSEDIEKIVLTMREYFDDDTIADFVLLSKLFGDTRYQLLIRKAMDIESRALISAAKNNKTFHSVVEWGEKSGIAKSSTLSDRKQYLKDLGVISERAEYHQNRGRGRPRKILFMSEENERKFEELFGKPVAEFLESSMPP